MKPSRLLPRLGLILALLAAADVHLALLQGYGWATMAWRGAHSGSVSRALSDTFDGQHPCSVCIAVKKAARGPGLRASSPVKAELFYQTAKAGAPARPARSKVSALDAETSGIAASPQTPPPKTFLS